MLTITEQGLVDYDPHAQNPLEEAILLSLFCDARSNEEASAWLQRGWWADDIDPHRPLGSRLWALIAMRGSPAEIAQIAQKEVENSLSWLEPERVSVDAKPPCFLIRVAKKGEVIGEFRVNTPLFQT